MMTTSSHFTTYVLRSSPLFIIQVLQSRSAVGSIINARSSRRAQEI